MATSWYATSVQETEDKDEKKGAKPKLSKNSKYVVLSESVIHSEKGEELIETAVARTVPEKYKNSTEFVRVLYNFPRDTKITLEVEMYKRAHLAKISDPVDFITYLQDANITPPEQSEPRTTTEAVATLCTEEKHPQKRDQPRHARSTGDRG